MIISGGVVLGGTLRIGALSAPAPTGQQAFTATGTFSWVAPLNVSTVNAVAVGAGGGGYNGIGGSGGGLGWKNNIAVTPGQSYTVVVGASGPVSASVNGGDSYFITTGTVFGGGGRSGGFPGGSADYWSGQFVGDGGGQGGLGGLGGSALGNWAYSGGGGGAGGYAVRAAYPVYGLGSPRSSGSGAGSGCCVGFNGENGGGGGGGGDWNSTYRSNAGNGGGVGILGQGTSGNGGTWGGVGSANDGVYGGAGNAGSGGVGQTYGGGGGANNLGGKCAGTIPTGSAGGGGAVRIIWGTGRAFPSTLTADQ